MVKDPTNKYYTNLLTYLKGLNDKLDGSQNENGTPPIFPFMFFIQIQGSTAATTLSNTEDGTTVGYEIKIYSKKSSEARTIANQVRTHMIESGFQCGYFNPVTNVKDTSISQFVCRFTKLET